MTGTQSRTTRRVRRLRATSFARKENGLFAMDATGKAMISVRQLWHIAGVLLVLKGAA